MLSSNHWEKDLDFSKKMEYILDEYYKKIFPKLFGSGLVEIIRNGSKSDNFIMDKYFGVDVIVKLKNRTITLQEKIRRNTYKGFNDFTIEYYSNEKTNPPIPGEWFFLSAGYYVYGYATESEDDLDNFKIVRWNEFRDWVSKNEDLVGTMSNLHHSKASFKYISWSDVPRHLIFYDHQRDDVPLS